MDTVPAYVDWRACTATPLSWVSLLLGPSKTPATAGINNKQSADLIIAQAQLTAVVLKSADHYCFFAHAHTFVLLFFW
jgi:hypothetical protein